EVAYGERTYDLENKTWTWLWHIDPTWPGDAYQDLDGDGMEVLGRFIGHNLDEYKYHTDPTNPDTDLDSYDVNRDGPTPGVDTNAYDFDELLIYGTDPNLWDTDGDGMSDGWEIWYGLNATDPNDRFADPDGDNLVNLDEFLATTHPKKWDTDSDRMPDGWEVKYGLDPLNPGDAEKDVDLDATGRPNPDGLINLFEYWNNTNPRSRDTDGDHLTDFEEIVEGFDVKVDGHIEHYYTCATSADTDKDDKADDEDNDNYFGADEEYLKDGPNGEALDNDGDGRADEELDLNDWNEARSGVRGYVTNASAPDTDGDGIDDWTEIFTDRDPKMPGIQNTDPTLSDTDNDGLTDLQEILGIDIWLPDRVVKVTVKTNPLKVDSDHDGLADGKEILTDFDPTPEELSRKGNVVSIVPVRDANTNDIIRFEVKYKDYGIVNSTNPAMEDTDGDGMSDGYEYDYSDLDRDGMPTWWEESYGLFKLKPTMWDSDYNGVGDAMEDFDLDGLTNLDEFRQRTDPNNADTDGNGIPDGDEPVVDQWGRHKLFRFPIYGDTDGDLMPDWWEILYGLNPNYNDSWGDIDADGFSNIDEYIYNTNVSEYNPDDYRNHPITYSPYSKDEDGDGIADWWEKLYFGDITACDPSDNPDGPPAIPWGDNWTNIVEWRHFSIFEENLYRTVPVPNWTDEFGNFVEGWDTDSDGKNDDTDPVPMKIPIMPVSRPMNPIKGAAALNPLKPDDMFGDTDNDGMSNLDEFTRPLGRTDPTDPDSDQDGMPDGWEWGYGKYDNATETVSPDPLDPYDAYDDPDMDGVNYSLKFSDKNGNHRMDEGENWTLVELDFNGDGMIDPLWENESFCNIEEYLMGLDYDADGMLENTTDPNSNDTDEDGLPDGFEVFFSDTDGDLLSNWYEIVYGLNPNDARDINGSAGDPDGDGYNNTAEYRARPWPTNPLNSESTPVTRGSRSVDSSSIENIMAAPSRED
ncbi:MAG: hypothetical protein DRJ64_04635, partial [Thermoprotei archaeon]